MFFIATRLRPSLMFTKAVDYPSVAPHRAPLERWFSGTFSDKCKARVEVAGRDKHTLVLQKMFYSTGL